MRKRKGRENCYKSENKENEKKRLGKKRQEQRENGGKVMRTQRKR